MDFCSTVNSKVLHDPWLVESVDEELQIQRISHVIIHNVDNGYVDNNMNLHVVQGSTVCIKSMD